MEEMIRIITNFIYNPPGYVLVLIFSILASHFVIKLLVHTIPGSTKRNKLIFVLEVIMASGLLYLTCAIFYKARDLPPENSAIPN